MILGIDFVSMILGGLAWGIVLFIVSVGLSVTMGLMGFVNLAHGAFAMLGGYIVVLSMRHLGVGFGPALVIGFFGTAAISMVFERTLYSRLYRAGELDQVLWSVQRLVVEYLGMQAQEPFVAYAAPRVDQATREAEAQMVELRKLAERLRVLADLARIEIAIAEMKAALW